MTIKIVLSSPLRTLPQSLRDSSLPEGAFEKFAAICLFSPFFMDSEATCCPDALSLQCVWGSVRRRIVWFSPPVLFSHLSRSVFKFLLTYGDKYLKILL